MMAQSSTPTGVNRYITMTKIAKPGTQGATRLGRSGGLQSLSGGISAALLSEIWLDHRRLILPRHEGCELWEGGSQKSKSRHKCFMQLFTKHETCNFFFEHLN